MNEQIWECIEFMEAKGYLIRPDVSPESYRQPRHLPFTLYPATMTRGNIELITKNQEIFNRLIHHATADRDYVKRVMEPIAAVDSFWRRLYDIWLKCAERNQDQIKLGLFRVDYMLEREEDDKEKAYLVEFNTIASGAGALCAGVTEMHAQLALRPQNVNSSPYPNNVLPNVLVNGLAAGIRRYSERYDVKLDNLIFVVMCEERRSANFCDQNKIQRAVQDALGGRVKTIKISYTKFKAEATFEAGDRIKLHDREVALVYYRAGYDPTCYKDEQAWETRTSIELARCVKCPPIEYHLATNKIFQASFDSSSCATRYIDHADFDSLKTTFPETSALDDMTAPVVRDAIAKPENYCLKILREGGAAGNLFGRDICDKLDEMATNVDERSKYILMRFLKPFVSDNYLVINGEAVKHSTVTEYSTFGGVLVDRGEILVNTKDGQLIRTKRSDVTSGGLMNGAATINSLHIVE